MAATPKIVEDTIRRWTKQKQDRGLWPQHWDDLSRVMLTKRLGFAQTTITGDRRTDDLYDGTAMQAARGLANAIAGMMRPEGEPWFFLKAADEADEKDGEARDWLFDTEERMRDAIDDPRARFRQAAGEVDLDLVVLGTGVMFINDVPGKDHLMFQSVWLKDAVPFFGEAGDVQGMFRSRKLTIRQIMANPRWTHSDRVNELIQQDKYDEKIEYLFAVIPREEGRKNALLARNLPVAEMVIEVESKHLAAEGGYHEFPYVVPRWDTTSSEDYGRSPGMIALPDANSSQAIGETILVAGQRAADPAMLAPSDAFIDAPNTYPGALASYEAEALRDLGHQGIKLLEPGGHFPISRDIQQDTREQIRNAFLRNVFNLPVDGPAMTATEVIQRKEEFIREIGPVFGRFESDYTAPTVTRQFMIMLRAGAFLPIPESLQGKGIRFEYESPVKKIREMAQALSAREWVFEQAELEQIKPGSMDNVDTDAYARFTHEARGLPAFLVRKEEEVDAIREQRAEQQAHEAQLAAAQQAAAALKDAGGAAKNLEGQDLSGLEEVVGG